MTNTHEPVPSVVRRQRLLAEARGVLAPLIGVLAAATLFALSCPPYDYWIAAWAVPGVLMVSTRHLRIGAGFACGVLYAVLIGALITSWAPRAALMYFDFNPILARAFIFCVHIANPGVPCGLMLATYIWARRWVTPGVRGVLGAWLWVLSELVRVWSLGWEILGHSQYLNLHLIQIADLGGVYAVSFVMALVSISLAELLVDAGRISVTLRSAAQRLALPLAGLLAVFAYGLHRAPAYAATTEGTVHNVAIVQGNIPNAYRWKRAFFARTAATYAELSRTAAPAPDLIVWPENAVSFYVNQDALLRTQLAEVAARASQGLLLGAPRGDEAHHAYNSVYLLDRSGQIAGIYDKQRLLPFAEYNPLQRLTGQADGDVYVEGTSAVPLRTATASIGTMICYEVLFPGLVRNLVRAGAELLVNVSNDSWMDSGDGVAPRQHLSMAVFRAVETRRFLVRAASSGSSGFVRPDGAIYSALPNNMATTAVAPVTLRHEQTVYVRWGDGWWFLGGLCLLADILRMRRMAAA